MSLRRALAAFETASQNDHWVIAYSAGADSALLLDLALAAASKLPQVRVTAVYLHHYGTELESERKRVIDFSTGRAKQMIGQRFSFCELRRDTARLARRLRRSWEHTASLWRRRQLERLSARLGGAQVFTGHQLSDYAETLQLRAERGIPASAWPLLSAHDAVTGFIRPLAYCTRRHVRSVVRQRRLAWYEDPSNSDLAIARNRLRQHARHVSKPALPGSVAQTNELLLRVHPREMRMPMAVWSGLTPVARARAIHQAWRQLSVVKKFTRNDFARAQRLPFSLPPLFVHAELMPEGEWIIFRRGLGAVPLNRQATPRGLRGDRVTRALTLRLPFGKKSVAKLFSERRLSCRQRRLTWIETGDGQNEALRVFFPDGAVL